jgi:hypothetical protein
VGGELVVALLDLGEHRVERVDQHAHLAVALARGAAAVVAAARHVERDARQRDDGAGDAALEARREREGERARRQDHEAERLRELQRGGADRADVGGDEQRPEPLAAEGDRQPQLDLRVGDALAPHALAALGELARQARPHPRGEQGVLLVVERGSQHALRLVERGQVAARRLDVAEGDRGRAVLRDDGAGHAQALDQLLPQRAVLPRGEGADGREQRDGGDGDHQHDDPAADRTGLVGESLRAHAVTSPRSAPA